MTLSGNTSRLHKIILQTDDLSDVSEKSAKEAYQKEKELFHAVDKVICLSNYTSDLLQLEYQLNSENLSVISNGLEDIDIASVVDREVLRKKWRVSGNESVILFTGRLQPEKGLSFLIPAFRKVLDMLPDCRLIIAGAGNYDAYLQEGKDVCIQVTFTGLLNRKELGEWYSLANVGVVPSLFETFGYVAVEMMMHGLPVVVTATSGLNEVVDDTCGLKVPLTKYSDRIEIDTDLLAEKIIYLLQHPEEAKEMGRKGRERYLKHYSSEIFRKNMLNFYHSLWNQA